MLAIIFHQNIPSARDLNIFSIRRLLLFEEAWNWTSHLICSDCCVFMKVTAFRLNKALMMMVVADIGFGLNN